MEWVITKWRFSAALSPTLVTYKAIEGDLQGIDHPG